MGENLWVFSKYVCTVKSSCVKMTLLHRRWLCPGGEARLRRGGNSLLLTWADPRTMPSLTHQVLVGKPDPSCVCNPSQQRRCTRVNEGHHSPLTAPSSKRGARRGGSTPSWLASLAFGESLSLYASRSGTGGAKLSGKKAAASQGRAVLPL